MKNQQFSPIYLLTGEENYYIDLLSDYFEYDLIPEECRDFDEVVVYGRDVSMGNVLDLALQCPVLASHRLVLVKEAQNISKKEEWDLLAGYATKPSPLTILVFCYRHKKLDKRSKAYKAILANGVVYEHSKLREQEVPDWILRRVQADGYNITERGAMLLTSFLGNDLAKLNNELGKLYISLPQGGSITEDLMERNIGISKDYNIFELQDALARRDVLKSNRIIKHFAENPKENPIYWVVAMLYSFFVSCMIYIQNKSLSESELVKAIGCHPYALKGFDVAARNYSLSKLASCIDYLYDADLKSKGVGNVGSVSDGEILKELVFKIIH